MMTILTAVLALAACAAATPDPEEAAVQAPVPSLNATGDPTSPARLPPGGGNAPTYPSGRTNPAWRGGTIGDPPRRRADWERGPGERAPIQPGAAGTPSGPAAEVVSPRSTEPEVNPGALEGGPQP